MSMIRVPIQFTLNGQSQAEFAESGSTLLKLLRDKIGVTATKNGCEQGTCGACTVLIDGRAQLSCLTLAERCGGKSVETLEGVSPDGTLHPLQEAFVNAFATQCGFCTAGMIMAGKALLDRNPKPTRDDVIDAVSGNICRCTGYEPIIQAILDAADKMRGQRKKKRA
jgi:aerobic carbon-monoxide dehydrogenase small subunit